ncbi:helix-turn-helix transcriptional regulator [Bacillus safensis]|uniref:helix-turn-helix domain-containing protein n=1 Tax=Bacillus TaxID=1386 RepID=UPI00125DEC31|nr:helix-turn-helix transcriptional regulator [Bacillus safensis]KAB3542581.1 helix-turn-helix transcriptional regulator [Bacillus safensis]KAB3543171.1 helix-turn-helix transcriptional regulator [Bacillus safensis]
MIEQSEHLDDLIKLGKRIRYLREDKGLSQESLGFLAGLHRNYISKLELAQKNPTYTTLIKLSIALEINIAELIQTTLEDNT